MEEFIHVGVTIDVTKPLKRRMKVKREGGEGVQIEFRYERLPTFYFVCGIIGHPEKFCPKAFEGVNMETEKPFGAWLRAASQRSTPTAGQHWLVLDYPLEREK